MDPQKILIVGASGYVGSRLVPLLLSRGHRVRALGRSLESLKQRPWAGYARVELFEADVFDKEALKKAQEGCFAAYYLVHSMNAAQKNFAEADRKAARNMIETAERSGLKRIIYLGGLINEQSPLSEHLRSREEVREILHSGKVPSTTLRAAMIIGTGSASFEILRYLVRRLPILPAPAWINTESQPIAIRNILNYLLGCLEFDRTAGEVYDIGGPEIISYRHLMRIFAEEAKLMKRLVVPVPFLPAKVCSFWTSLLTPLPPALIYPLTEGLGVRLVCRDDRIRELLPQDLLTCRHAVRLALHLGQKDFKGAFGAQTDVPPAEWRYPGDPSWVGR